MKSSSAAYLPGAEVSGLERWLMTVRNGLFSTLYLIAKDTKRKPVLCMTYNIMEFLQMYAFPMMHDERFPWITSEQWSCRRIAQVLRFSSLVELESATSSSVFLTAFGLAITFIVCLLGLMSWVAYNSMKQLPQSNIMLRVLRWLATLSITALFLPTVMLLLSGTMCDSVTNSWHGSTIRCNSGGHVGIVILCVMLLIVFVVATSVLACSFIDRNPISDELAARFNGRLDVFMMQCKTLLAILYTVAFDRMSFGFLLALLAIVGVSWMYLFGRVMPLAAPNMNEFKIGGIAIFCWLTLCSILAHALGHDVGVAVVFGTPLAGLSFALLTHARILVISKASLNDLRSASPLTLSFWGRLQIREVFGHKAHKDKYIDEIETNVMSRADHVKTIEQAFIWAADRDGSASGLIHMQYSAFCRLAHKYNFAEVAALQKAFHASSWLDVQFFVYQRTRQLQESTESDLRGRGHAAVSNSTGDQVSFEQHVTEAETARVQYYKLQSEMYTLLMETIPDFPLLEKIGHQLISLRSRLIVHYSRILAMNDTSIKALRAYATFLDEIMHDGDLAEEYFTRARRVEESVSLRGAWEAKTFAFGTRVDGVSHMDEHDAVLVITGAPRRLGEIVSANTKSAAMLCYQRVVLIGKYMHTLFPAPLSRWIQSELDTLAATGQCFIIENPMLMPVITSNGVLIPVVFHLKQHIPEAAGCPPQLMLVLKPVASDCEIVICDDSGAQCMITGATSGALQKLAIDPQVFTSRAGGVPLSSVLLVSDLAAIDVSRTMTINRHNAQITMLPADGLTGCPTFVELLIDFEDGCAIKQSSALKLAQSQRDVEIVRKSTATRGLSENPGVSSALDDDDRVNAADSENPDVVVVKQKDAGSKPTGNSSSGSSAFRHNIRRVRRDLQDPNVREPDLHGMITSVRLLTFVLALFCVAVVVAYSTYADTLKSYARLITNQGDKMRTIRMASKALQDATWYNYGLEDFGPLEKRHEEFKWYISEAQTQHESIVRLASQVCKEVQEDRRKPGAMTFLDVRADGSIVNQNLSIVEGVNLILIRSHNIDEMDNSLWTKSNIYIQTMYTNMNSRFTAAYNASNLFTIVQMASAMDTGSRIALIAFLTSFFFIAALLVVQFVMSVRNLAQQNFSTLVALAKIPKKTVSQLKDRADELYFQYNAEAGEGEENEEWIESDSDIDDDHNLGRIGMNGRHRLRNKDRIPTSFDDTTLFTLKSTSMLTAPICTVLLWFSLIYYMDNTMSRQIWTHSAHEYVVQQTGMNVVNILDTVLIPTAYNMPERAAYMRIIDDNVNQLRTFQSLLTGGGTFMSRPVDPIPDTPLFSQVFRHDSCYSLTVPLGNYDTPGYKACVTAQNGVYRQSYFGVVMKVTDLAMTAGNLIPMNNDTRDVILATPYAESLVKLGRIDNPFFRNITDSMGHALLDLQLNILDEFAYTLQTFSIAFVITFTVFVLIAYVPMIRRTGRHVTSTQSVLLLFTDDQLAELASLRVEIRAIVQHLGGVGVGIVPKRRCNLLQTFGGAVKSLICCRRKSEDADAPEHKRASFADDIPTSKIVPEDVTGSQSVAEEGEVTRTPVRMGQMGTVSRDAGRVDPLSLLESTMYSPQSPGAEPYAVSPPMVSGTDSRQRRLTREVADSENGYDVPTQVPQRSSVRAGYRDDSRGKPQAQGHGGARGNESRDPNRRQAARQR